jgi:predicted dehydrogenase
VELDPVRIAVIGAGAFGKNHLRVLSAHPGAALAAVVDTDSGRASQAQAEFGCQIRTLTELPGSVEAAVVAVPTTAHPEVASFLLESGIDVLVEKPIAASLDEARRLTELARSRGRILQVGHLERFNPAVSALQAITKLPLFFEIHRMNQFSPRSLDVDVVLDLMIHDVDIVLTLVDQMPCEVRAAGVSILSEKSDIANVRLAFPTGCVANLTASRVSTEKIRKLRMFQPHEYISVDYARRDGMAIGVSETKQISFRPLGASKEEPLKLELEAFLESVRSRSAPLVTGEQACAALEVALDILDKIEKHSGVVAETLAAHGFGVRPQP